MNDYGLLPRPPQWALHAGLPHPTEGETFCEYVTRIGYCADELLADLCERTMPLANYRLATNLQRSLPHVFSAHVRSLVEIHVPTERQRELDNIAANLFNVRLRPTPVLSMSL